MKDFNIWQYCFTHEFPISKGTEVHLCPADFVADVDRNEDLSHLVHAVADEMRAFYPQQVPMTWLEEIYRLIPVFDRDHTLLRRVAVDKEQDVAAFTLLCQRPSTLSISRQECLFGLRREGTELRGSLLSYIESNSQGVSMHVPLSIKQGELLYRLELCGSISPFNPDSLVHNIQDYRTDIKSL